MPHLQTLLSGCLHSPVIRTFSQSIHVRYFFQTPAVGTVFFGVLSIKNDIFTFLLESTPKLIGY